jgi:hypothetical protein
MLGLANFSGLSFDYIVMGRDPSPGLGRLPEPRDVPSRINTSGSRRLGEEHQRSLIQAVMPRDFARTSVYLLPDPVLKRTTRSAGLRKPVPIR